MALDTAGKRFSSLNVSSPWRGISYFPTGTIDAPERLAVSYYYSGIAAGTPVVMHGGIVYVFGWVWDKFE